LRRRVDIGSCWRGKSRASTMRYGFGLVRSPSGLRPNMVTMRVTHFASKMTVWSESVSAELEAVTRSERIRMTAELLKESQTVVSTSVFALLRALDSCWFAMPSSCTAVVLASERFQTFKLFGKKLLSLPSQPTTVSVSSSVASIPSCQGRRRKQIRRERGSPLLFGEYGSDGSTVLTTLAHFQPPNLQLPHVDVVIFPL
jgi:hypothetical protein